MTFYRHNHVYVLLIVWYNQDGDSMTNKKISMQFPKRENDDYLDGKVHEVQPVELRRINVPAKDLFLLTYDDLSRNYDNCMTVVARVNGMFYKIPLDNYDERMEEIYANSSLDDLSMINQNIRLGVGMKTDNLLGLIRNTQRTVVATSEEPRPSIAAGSPNGPTPPPIIGENAPPIPPDSEEINIPLEKEDYAVGMVVKNDDDSYYINYYGYDKKKIVNSPFENNPNKTFAFFEYLKPIRSVAIENYNELFQIRSLSDYNSVGQKIERRVTDVLVNYEIQNVIYRDFDGSESGYHYENCIADCRFTFFKDGDVQLIHDGTYSQFVGFPRNVIYDPYNNPHTIMTTDSEIDSKSK